MSAPDDSRDESFIAARTEGSGILNRGLVDAYISGEHSDCKLSGYFKSALRKGTFKEGESGTIELKAIQSDSGASEDANDLCDDPENVKLMVKYFYHLDYFPTAENPSPKAEAPAMASDHEQSAAQSPTSATVSASVTSQPRVHIIEHASVFAMAVKYKVDGLRDLAAVKFKQSVKAHWSHDDFVHAISIVHTSTADDITQLRNIVAETIHEHFDTLKLDADFENVVMSIPRLAYGLLLRVGTISCCTNGHSGVMRT